MSDLNNIENLPKPKTETEKSSIEKRNLIQKDLIKDFCKNSEIKNIEERTKRAFDWILKYADNFDQLDEPLIDEYYRLATSGTEEDNVRKAELLSQIQTSLVELDNKNG
ncbi:MAG: hypothetical protein A2746_00945 [Candidatus Yanofskybacteria bacterium RIFCSPHIGHO2_01_FULL_44_22]|uniref:Uncharacterized protein n=2 Tax=Parcubacteria group TaxID=1794811 RepID=A0A1F8EWR0_9BACT|nr:MAG: hypothetical protein UT16_C0012G0009 [Candidatus Azambacteria bacterium GW2011_GWA2_39_10]OGN05302.1 MAG: hypothetical protein A2746_00945 [Candidatus Yanofskybacteria bacterium RIFCSPHIGHO2_01_FULL_44_22]